MTQGLDGLAFRETSARIVATLTRILGPRHITLAEEVAQDALVKALQTWPHEGVPVNPFAWLVQVAKHRALDVLRRDKWFADRADALAARLETPSPHDAVTTRGVDQAIGLRGEPAPLDDDDLAMIFLACHPVLAREARVALTLKTVCGFGVGEIARALLSREDAVAQRLVRAKRQLRDADVRFELEPSEYATRLDSVVDVLYLLFNEGYAAHAGDDLIRAELCAEAIRLASLIADHATLATPAVHALLALMLLQAARLPARVDEDAELKRLVDQDRSRWDRALIQRGMRHLDRAAAGDTLTTYHLEAGIAACHASASRYEDTPWSRIVDLYDTLIAVKPTPIVALNRAIALSRLHGAAAGIAAIEAIAGDPALARYYLLPATMGELMRESGNVVRAAEYFEAALECECSEPERRFIERRLRETLATSPTRLTSPARPAPDASDASSARRNRA